MSPSRPRPQRLSRHSRSEVVTAVLAGLAIIVFTMVMVLVLAPGSDDSTPTVPPTFPPPLPVGVPPSSTPG